MDQHDEFFDINKHVMTHVIIYIYENKEDFAYLVNGRHSD